ncbi:hypothetical protein ACFWR9_19115 [Streptomyces sp. NPDC058534]|uniref:hypothetical protein n=1 Tax=Streptomyces sp. NPDC058534 TaxID=3346541 RepID=UPI003664F659
MNLLNGKAMDKGAFPKKYRILAASVTCRGPGPVVTSVGDEPPRGIAASRAQGTRQEHGRDRPVTNPVACLASDYLQQPSTPGRAVRKEVTA